MLKRFIIQMLAALVTLGATNMALATPIEARGYYAFLDDWGNNPLGVAPGVYGNVGGHFRPIGCDDVNPCPAAADTQLMAQQGAFSTTLFSRASPAFPYEYGRMAPIGFLEAQGLTGPWTLTATNGANTTHRNTLVPAISSPPQISNVQTNGLSTTPTFSWTRPNYVAPAGYNAQTEVVVWDLSLAPGHQTVHRQIVALDATSYAVPNGILSPGKNYVVSVEATLRNQADAGLLPMLTFGSLAASTRNFFNFTPSENPVQFDQPVNLPVETQPGVFTFSMDVVDGTPYLLDPLVAIGYEFAIGAGDPLFASILLPDLGNFLYQLYLWNGTDWIFDSALAALSHFAFEGPGVDRFRIMGIDPLLALDPNNPTAFVTEVSFAGSGRFTGTMTAITAEIPEPSSIILLGLGLLGLAHIRRKSGSVAPVR